MFLPKQKSKILRMISLLIILAMSSYLVLAKRHGFQNCGNSCYMNASLQCLLNVRMLSIELKKHQASLEKDAITNEYLQLVDLYAEKHAVPLRPAKFYAQEAAAFFPKSSSTAQQDAAEFIRKLLDRFYEKVPQIGQLFASRNISRITCPNCGYKSEKIDSNIDPITFQERSVNNHLNLEIVQPTTPNTPSNLVMCMDAFFMNEVLKDTIPLTQVEEERLIALSLQQAKTKQEREELDMLRYKTERWICNSCHKLVSATKQLLLDHAPPIFIIVLKRFFKLPTGQFDKNELAVSFPLDNVDISKYLAKPEPTSYLLTGFVVQTGSLTGGHYWAYTKGPKKKTWKQFDDASVSGPINDKLIEQIGEKNDGNGTPYILFYERKELPPLQKKLIALEKALVTLKENLTRLQQGLLTLKNKF